MDSTNARWAASNPDVPRLPKKSSKNWERLTKFGVCLIASMERASGIVSIVPLFDEVTNTE